MTDHELRRLISDAEASVRRIDALVDVMRLALSNTPEGQLAKAILAEALEEEEE